MVNRDGKKQEEPGERPWLKLETSLGGTTPGAVDHDGQEERRAGKEVSFRTRNMIERLIDATEIRDLPDTGRDREWHGH